MRSEAEKWKVPESDPAGMADKQRIEVPASTGTGELPEMADERGLLIFCGMCGALNPATRFYCAACGSTLVDAFHATEGLRVFERPDAASRIIEIVPAGIVLDINEDPDAPRDYVRIRLENGKLGYVRLAEVEAMATAPAKAVSGSSIAADINTNARGCVSTTGALASLVLLVLLSTLALYLINQEDSAEAGFLALVTCLVVAPLALLMIVLYLMARDREDRRLEEEQVIAAEGDT